MEFSDRLTLPPREVLSGTGHVINDCSRAKEILAGEFSYPLWNGSFSRLRVRRRKEKSPRRAEGCSCEPRCMAYLITVRVQRTERRWEIRETDVRNPGRLSTKGRRLSRKLSGPVTLARELSAHLELGRHEFYPENGPTSKQRGLKRTTTHRFKPTEHGCGLRARTLSIQLRLSVLHEKFQTLRAELPPVEPHWNG